MSIIKKFNATQLANLEAIYKVMKSSKITNPMAQAGILAVGAKESGLTIVVEYDWVDNDLPSIKKFNFIKPVSNVQYTIRSLSDKKLEKLKKDPKQWWDFIYGGQGGNSTRSQLFPVVDDYLERSEGFKYKGRGFNQITFRGNYEVFGKQAGVDIVTNPDKMLSLDYAPKIYVAYYEYIYKYTGVLAKWGVKDINQVTNLEDAVGVAFHATAGAGNSKEGVKTAVPEGWKRANLYVSEFYEWIMKKEGLQPDPAANQPSQTLANNQQTANQAGSGQSQTSTQQQQTSRELPVNNAKPNSELSGTGIKNLVPTKLKAREIRFQLPPQPDTQKDIAINFAKFPFVWYNSYQIAERDIKFLYLSTTSGIPTLKLSFNDTYNLMKDKAFPLDDTNISIFINTLSEQLNPIHLDFKIVNFKLVGKTYTVQGVLDINALYLKRFKSVPKMTSFSALKTLAEEVGLGFNSNIDDTDDNMTWVSTGERLYKFIDKIVSNSYKSDEAYLAHYIDYFYNLNYIEIEKELNRNIKQELGVTNIGLSEMAKVADKNKVTRLFLTNDQSLRDSNSFFSEYRIVNSSTGISLEEGYLTKVKYYDELKKELLVFDVDSITSEGDKTIIMKGSPKDEEFFKNNVQLLYVGKLDSDNMHKNFNYSMVQNSRNLVDLEKVAIELKMVHPNYNLLKYQKVFVLISNQHSTPANSHANNRLSGEWLVIDISYKFDGKSFDQIIKLVKRELDLSPEEIAQEGSSKKPNVEPGKNYDNNKPQQPSTQNLTQPANDPVGTTVSGVAPITNESGDMAVTVPPVPSSPTESSPSKYPIKADSYVRQKRPKVNQIMLHYTAGWQITDKCKFAVEGVQARTLSYHYIIGVEGHIENLVDPIYYAAHGRDANEAAIGISLECLGVTHPEIQQRTGQKATLKYCNDQLDNLRKGTYTKQLYGKGLDYVNLVDFDGNPTTYRNFTIAQEVSDAQLNALGSLLKHLKSRFPDIPSFPGLTAENYKILFPAGTTWKAQVPGLYTHSSYTTGKVDIMPTPKIVNFLKRLRY